MFSITNIPYDGSNIGVLAQNSSIYTYDHSKTDNDLSTAWGSELVESSYFEFLFNKYYFQITNVSFFFHV